MTEQSMHKLRERSAVLRGVDLFTGWIKGRLGPQEPDKILTARAGAADVTASKAIEFADPFENMGAQMVREVVSITSKAAGDGTTTAAVLAQAIFRGGVLALDAGADAEAVKRGIALAVRAVCGYERTGVGGERERIKGELDRLSRPMDDELLVRLSAASAGDERVGEIAAEAVKMAGGNGAISVEPSSRLETTIERTTGLNFRRGYLSPYFVTDPERMECVLEDACVLICEEEIMEMQPLLPAIEFAAKAGKPLLIIAADVKGEALASLVLNKLRGIVRCAAVKAPGIGERREAALEDIAVVTGGKVVRLAFRIEESLGRAERIVIRDDQTTIIAGEGATAEIESRVKDLRTQFERSGEAYDREYLRKRIEKLESGVVRIKVGAATEMELREKTARVEQSVHAAILALKEGVAPGGGAALVHSITALDHVSAEADERIGANIVKRALTEPLRVIAQNAGHDGDEAVRRVSAASSSAFGFNAQTGQFGDLVEAGIVDSVEVVRVAIEKAASIASLYLTAEPPVPQPAEILTAPPAAESAAPSEKTLSVNRAAEIVLPVAASSQAARPSPAEAPSPASAVGRGAKAERSTRVDRPRYANICFTKGSDHVVVPKTNTLQAGAHYQLRLNIGRWRAESAVEFGGRRPFPSDLLPESRDGHWLDVVAVSDEFKIGGKRHALFLPVLGESWVCACQPDGDHQCLKSERAPHLFIPLTAPRASEGGAREAAKPKPFMASLRLGIYYQNNLIQSQFLRAAIARRERPGDGYNSTVDYTLTAELSDVGFLPHRTLNILTNRNSDGSHKIVINGRTDAAIAFNLSEGQMRDALGVTRDAMRSIHVDGKPPNLKNKYDGNNAKPKAAFLEDLENLAFSGWRLFTGLFQDKPQQRRQLPKGLLRDPSIIQVARVQGGGFVFPWAFIYDIGLESDRKARLLCRLLKEWDGSAPLVDGSSRRCPFESEHAVNTLCPFGFWGFRHIIEAPPSSPPERPLTLRIPISHALPEVVLGLSLDLDHRYTSAHLETMKKKLTNLAVIRKESRDALRDALSESKLELVYFYCHARRELVPGAETATPYLEVGMKEGIPPSDIITWDDDPWGKVPNHWESTSPLVFINGCHTAELTPDALVNFVDAFAGVYAAGVIGTEVIIHQQVANEAAEQFFERFLSHRNVGQSISEMRLRFLSKGNLMGLAYTPYCSADLALAAPS